MRAALYRCDRARAGRSWHLTGRRRSGGTRMNMRADIGLDALKIIAREDD